MGNNINNIKQHKAKIRQSLRTSRNNLTKQDVTEKSLAICRHIKNHSNFNLINKLGLYLAHGREVKLNYLLQDCLTLNKECYAPVINYPRAVNHIPKMKFHRVSCLPHPIISSKNNQSKMKPLIHLWRKNIYGIDEPYQTPSIDTYIDMWKIDAVFMPLVAFDEQGGRLGMGGGYYDATFSFCRAESKRFTKRPLLIGVAYELQRIKSVPLEAEDIKMDWVVTENGWMKPSTN